MGACRQGRRSVLGEGRHKRCLKGQVGAKEENMAPWNILMRASIAGTQSERESGKTGLETGS